jgi:hypothetical protein
MNAAGQRTLLNPLGSSIYLNLVLTLLDPMALGPIALGLTALEGLTALLGLNPLVV